MFSLPDLPYEYDALSPVDFRRDDAVSPRQAPRDLHQDAEHTARDVRAVVRHARGGRWPTPPARRRRSCSTTPPRPGTTPSFGSACHPRSSQPSGELADAIGSAFGGQDKLKEAFVTGGVDQFGSGWVWLVADASGALKIVSTHDADNALVGSVGTPLIVCDVWEHAYYLDYQNERKGFLEAWFDALPNWDLAARQFSAAKGSGKAWTFAEAGQ